MPRALLAVCPLLLGLSFQASRVAQTSTGEWRYYAGDPAATRYSPLDQIDRDNIARLRIAWRWASPDGAIVAANPLVRPGAYQDTPLMVKGVLYTATSLGQFAALDPGSGRTIWTYDPESWKTGRPTNLGFVHRGVAYWGDAARDRILMGTGDAYLLSIDAKTGKPDPQFGDGGRVDLIAGVARAVRATNYTVSSAPVICRNVVVVGASISDNPNNKEAPRGDVSGYDVVTGKKLWTFPAIPKASELGHDTWEDGSAEYTGNTNVWTSMSADQDLGYVYLPFGTPTNDFYGGHRPGHNLFAESLVALDVRTGTRVWHFQGVHHGVWDYDFPAAPALVDIRVGGRRIQAAAQVSKQGFTYVFDRRTGRPVWPIEERPVGASAVPGERLSPTQPFPTTPPPFERQGVTENDVIDYTPELRAQALEMLKRFDYGPLFTPPSEKGTVQLPGWAGGANLGGAAFDPDTGLLYVPTYTSPIVVQIVKGDPARGNLRYRRGGVMSLPTIDGLPILKGPYSRVVAIDLNKGEIAWSAVTGDGPRHHPLLQALNMPPLGTDARGHAIVTKTLLFHTHGGGGLRGGEVAEPFQGRPLTPSLPREPFKLRAFDKKTGVLVWEGPLPSSPAAAPMTYLHNGTQFIVVAVGGGPTASLVAFALNGH